MVPPGTKPNARFLNLAATMKWAATMLRLLNDPATQSRVSLSTARLNLKLGWLREYASDVASREIVSRLTAFLQTQEAGLRAGERIPLSTEILESSFGLFKQSEGQQSKGSFTSWLAAFGAVLQPTTPESVREAFWRVSVKDAKIWIKDHISQTLTAKRQSVYREYKSKRPGATKAAATA